MISPFHIVINCLLSLQIEATSKLALGAFHYACSSSTVTTWLMQIAARRSLVVALVGDSGLVDAVLLLTRRRYRTA